MIRYLKNFKTSMTVSMILARMEEHVQMVLQRILANVRLALWGSTAVKVRSFVLCCYEMCCLFKQRIESFVFVNHFIIQKFSAFIHSTISYSDIDDCKPGLCKNGGTCVDGIDSYTCKCARGFEGIDCAISKIMNIIFV